MSADITCGTRGGWNQHMKRGEVPCPDCRRSNTEYMREYRATRSEARERDRRDSRTRNRALARLAIEHPADYLRLMAEERARTAEEESA